MSGDETRGRRAGPGTAPTAGASHAEWLRLRAALLDSGTGLQSLAAEMEAVRVLLTRSRIIGIVHVEVDPQARVETIYGWQVLERILQAVARELHEMKRGGLPPGSLVCQAGVYSDRFLIVMPHARADARQGPPAASLEETCRSLRARLARRFEGEDFQSMASKPALQIGATALVEHPFFRLERQIYRALDEARAAGARGQEQDRARRHAELKRIIREGAIETLFQPILDLRSGVIVGYEAFSRGPEDTVFEAPAVLFECSREAGMEGELDLLCQRTALKQARKLPPGEKLFLNALAGSLLDPGFREGLLAELPPDFPVARGDIVLEIVDRHAIEDIAAFGSEVGELRARGFRVSVDDVGRGPSTVEAIAAISPDFIKVDASVIRNIHKDLVKCEILRTVCREAREKGAVVIAEAIESPDELDAVRKCGATLGQGHLFYRPSRELPARKARAQRGGT